jgi:hypothetical protein
VSDPAHQKVSWSLPNAPPVSFSCSPQPNTTTEKKSMFDQHLNDRALHQLLERVDNDLTQELHDAGCPHCKGKLHRADYPRKPRGGAEHWDRRQSLCCGREGCRRRLTPPSVRFFGRKLYNSLAVVLLSAMNQGISPRRLEQLTTALGVHRRTLERWRKWWLETFIQSRFWKGAKARFMPPVEQGALPRCLWERFGAEDQFGVVNLLRFLGPLTSVSGMKLWAM